MKQKLILTILISLSFLTISVIGQSIKIGVGGGYTALTGDNSFDPENILNLNSGYHYGGKLVVGLPLFPIQFTGGYYQNTLSSETTINDENVTSETDFSSIGLGAEMSFLPGPVNPYISAEVLFTSFGEPTINDVSIGESTSETGLGLGAGVYFKLIPVIDLDLSARYNMNTLFSDGDELNSTNIRLNILFSIL